MEYFWVREKAGYEPNDSVDLIGLLKVEYRKKYDNRIFLYGKMFLKNRGGGFNYYPDWSCSEDIIEYDGTPRDWEQCDALRIYDF